MSWTWKWRARLYDVCESSSLRRGPHKRVLFRHMAGRVLFVAVGTGADIEFFPPGLDITAIDISWDMLRRAEARRHGYPGALRLVHADALSLPFSKESFDTVATSCTLCSVPNPLQALRELHRVLRPRGQLLMFEHVRSRNAIFGLTLDLMTLWTRRLGTEMNRDTVANIRKAGFRITRIDSVYLDIILAIRGTKLQRGELAVNRAVGSSSQRKVTKHRLSGLEPIDSHCTMREPIVRRSEAPGCLVNMGVHQ